MRTVRSICLLFFILTVCSSSAAAASDWSATYSHLHECIKKRDEACAVKIAEDVTQRLKPHKKIDHSKKPGKFMLPSERLMLLSNLVVYFAIRGDTQKAEHYFELAYKERMIAGHMYTGRPTNTARRYLIAAHLKDGNANRLTGHLEAVTDYSGQAADLERKLFELTQAILFLGRAGYKIDEAKSAMALEDWLLVQDRSVSDAGAKIVRSLVRNGFITAAEAIARRFADVDIDRSRAAAIAQLNEKREELGKLVEIASSGSPDQIFTEPDFVKKTPGRSLYFSIQQRVYAVVNELTRQKRLDLLGPVLSAGGRYAATIKSQNCKIMLLTTFLNHAVLLDDPSIYKELKELVPVTDDGEAAIIGNRKCENNLLEFRVQQPIITQAIMDGIPAISRYLDSTPTDQPNKKLSGVLYTMSINAPFLDQAVVAALYSRYSDFVSRVYKRSLPLALVLNASFARKSGYDDAAFVLLDRALQAGLSHSGDPTRENMIKSVIGALFEWRVVAGNMRAKAKLQ